jgi:hypothetical protein
MFSRYIQHVRRSAGIFALLCLACAGSAAASATLLLEEPYGKLGFFTPTGHAAVYLSDICAETPVVLRPCAPGETGVVISRYDGVDGYDWMAIPLIPYLYAVERPEDVPLFADVKMVAFLRNRYRRQHLAEYFPDGPNGEAPGGNWYELVGSAYDRATYGFEIATSPERDLALIQKLNTSANMSHFHTVSQNCADFAKDIINFYYPRTLHRSVVADVGITTPKQMARLLVRFETRHPELAGARYVIAQVPGSMPRSNTVRGVVDAFLHSKKYFVPSAIASPVFGGCVVAVYLGTRAGSFDPSRGALVYSPDGMLAQPLGHEDARSYQTQLRNVVAEDGPIVSAQNVEKAWAKQQANAKAGIDELGRPILQMQVEGRLVRVGAAAGNVLDGNAPPGLTRELLEARLQSELRRGAVRSLSLDEVDRDWNLLQQTNSGPTLSVASHSQPDASTPAIRP